MTFERKLYVYFAAAFLIFAPLTGVFIYGIKKIIFNQSQGLAVIAKETLLVERMQFFNASKAGQIPAYLLSGDSEFLRKFETFNTLFIQTLDDAERIAPKEDRPLFDEIKRRSHEAYEMSPHAPEMLANQIAPRIVNEFFTKHVRSLTSYVDQGARQLALLLANRHSLAKNGYQRTITLLEWAVIFLGVMMTLTTLAVVTLLVKMVNQKKEFDMESARISESRKEVVEVVAHDIKSPAATIQMMLDQLKEDLVSSGATEGLQNGLDLIDRSVKAIASLVSDILDHAKIESGNLELQTESCSLNVLLEGLVERFAPLARQKCVGFRTNIDSKEILGVVDIGRMDQAISNLLSNAIKFTPESGAIILSCVRGEHEVLISVADSGPGLNGEQKLHIFERYWQARKGGNNGTGLGLSIVKSIVDAHKGKIWVDSEPNCGSKFSLSIPI